MQLCIYIALNDAADEKVAGVASLGSEEACRWLAATRQQSALCVVYKHVRKQR